MHRNLSDYQSVEEALADLCDGLVEGAGMPPDVIVVEADDIPSPVRQLLVHHDHMTTKLEDHHGRAVELRVLDHRLDEAYYRRRILLTLEGGDEVVEYGIVRIDLSFVPKAVREAILERRAPLGDILIRHDVLRRIEPRWYLRIEPDSALLRGFGDAPEDDVFGRVGTIYCNEAPAIELLEIVTGVLS